MTSKYALATFAAPGLPKGVGIVVEDRITALSAAAPLAGVDGAWMIDASMLDLLERWGDAEKVLDRLVTRHMPDLDARALPLRDVDVRAPVRPRQIFCTGANYKKHVVDLTVDTNTGPEGVTGEALRRWAEEMMDERQRTGDPYVFTKPISVLAGPNDKLRVPPTTKKLDWEAELCVVIGKGGYEIPLKDAMAHVAGYCIANDISARDLIPRTDYKLLGTDWLRAKGQPGFLPLGPVIVPAQFVPDPYALTIKLSVNGQVMQNEAVSDMLFDIARQIEYISRYAELLPGDVICTGSPAGNGTHYNRFLGDGDVMVAEITGLGVQRVVCVGANG